MRGILGLKWIAACPSHNVSLHLNTVMNGGLEVCTFLHGPEESHVQPYDDRGASSPPSHSTKPSSNTNNPSYFLAASK